MLPVEIRAIKEVPLKIPVRSEFPARIPSLGTLFLTVIFMGT
jgi:hypothetical protein